MPTLTVVVVTVCRSYSEDTHTHSVCVCSDLEQKPVAYQSPAVSSRLRKLRRKMFTIRRAKYLFFCLYPRQMHSEYALRYTATRGVEIRALCLVKRHLATMTIVTKIFVWNLNFWLGRVYCIKYYLDNMVL